MLPHHEILWTYESRGEQDRRLLLRQVGNLSPSAETAAIRDLLEREAEGPLATSARLALCQRLRSDCPVGLGLAPRDPHLDPLQNRGLAWEYFPPPPDREEEQVGLERRARAELDDLVPFLRGQLENRGSGGRQALQTLARIGTQASLGALLSLPGDQLSPVERFQALALDGSEAAAAAAQRDLVQLPKAVAFGLLPFFAELPGCPPSQILEDAFGGEAIARAAAAHALEGCPETVRRTFLPALLQDGDPWVQAHALETLARVPPPDSLELLRRLWAAGPSPLVAPLLFRALALAAPEGAEELAREALASPDPRVRAGALEALASSPIEDAELLRLATPSMAAEHPRLALAATLVVAPLDPEAAARTAERMVLSRDAEAQLRGIHALAFVDEGEAGEILQRILQDASAGPLKEEALRSLGLRAQRYPDGLFPLRPRLKDPDPAVRVHAATVLLSAHPLAVQEGARAVAIQLDGEDDDQVALQMLRVLPQAGPALEPALRSLHSLLESGGALVPQAGSCLCWGLPESDAAQSLGERHHPLLRALGVVRAWSLGRGELGPLLGWAERCPPESRRDLMQLLEAVVTATSAIAKTPRLHALERRLRLSEALEIPFPEPRRDRGGASSHPLDTLSWLCDPEATPQKPAPNRTTRSPRRQPRRPARKRRRTRSLGGLPPQWQGASPEALRAAVLRCSSLPPPPAALSPSGKRFMAGIAGILLLAGLAIRVAPRPSPQAVAARRRPAKAAPVRAAPPPSHQAKAQVPRHSPGPQASEAWDQLIEELAVKTSVRPTATCPVFEERWQELREWIVRELDMGRTICTYTDLMRLRFRHLRGDETAHEVLDGYYRKAGGWIQDRRIAQDTEKPSP